MVLNCEPSAIRVVRFNSPAKSVTVTRRRAAIERLIIRVAEEGFEHERDRLRERDA